MSVIVAVFDDERDLERALGRLSDAGLDDTVYDRAIVSQESDAGIGPLYAAASGSFGTESSGYQAEAGPARRAAVVHAFKKHLADEHVDAATIGGYAVNFEHGGKFVIVRAGGERADEAVRILEACRPQRVDRHG